MSAPLDHIPYSTCYLLACIDSVTKQVTDVSTYSENEMSLTLYGTERYARLCSTRGRDYQHAFDEMLSILRNTTWFIWAVSLYSKELLDSLNKAAVKASR